MFTVEPIGIVRSPRRDLSDDGWGAVEAEIELLPSVPPSSLEGLEAFSHAEIVFLFDRVDPAKVVRGKRRPRGNPAWPEVGIFAQRGKDRPNRIGTTIARVAGRSGSRLRVVGLDAIDGTPVLDVKPVMTGFLPRGTVEEPPWARELMLAYWDGEPPSGA